MPHTRFLKALKRARWKSARARLEISSDMVIKEILSVADFEDFIRVNIHDLCQPVVCLGGRDVAALEVGMSVEVIARLCHADQPVDGFQPLMGMRIVIVDPK